MSANRTLAAMAMLAAISVFGVICRPLLPIDETRYLTVAWEMHLSGDWLVPHLNGEIYTHKPPLLFWLINLVWSIFGVGEFMARLIAPAFGVAAVGVTSLIGRRMWQDKPESGGQAALILACSAVFAAFSGLTMFDAMLTFSVALGVLALTYVPQSVWAWVGLGAAMALGALSKGPVVLLYLLPLALTVSFWAPIRLKQVALGTGLALAVGLILVGLWLVPAILIAGPEYRDAVLWKQHAGRVVDSFAHVRPWWFFIVLMPLFAWPWAWSADLWRGVRNIDRSDRGLRLLAIWFGVPFLLFSLISGKQIHYLLPTFPAIALFLAQRSGDGRFSTPVAALLPAILGSGMIVVGLDIVDFDRLGTLVEPSWLFVCCGLVLLLSAILIVKRYAAGAYLAGPLLVVTINCMFLFGAPGIVYDSTPIATALAPHEENGIAVGDGSYAGEFTFTGRLTRPVTRIESLDEATAWLSAAPGRALLVRLDRPHPEAPPEETTVFRNKPYGIWGSRDKPPQEGG